jgi:hypothetical protein
LVEDRNTRLENAAAEGGSDLARSEFEAPPHTGVEEKAISTDKNK